MMPQQYQITFVQRFLKERDPKEHVIVINEEFLSQQIEILVVSGHKVTDVTLIER